MGFELAYVCPKPVKALITKRVMSIAIDRIESPLVIAFYAEHEYADGAGVGCVAKNMLGHKNAERHFNSGGNLEEIGHESNLSANVAFPDSFDLALPNHVRGLITADGPPRRLETEEA